MNSKSFYWKRFSWSQSDYDFHSNLEFGGNGNKQNGDILKMAQMETENSKRNR